MSLLTAGYWPTTFWADSYYTDGYWQDYGVPAPTTWLIYAELHNIKYLNPRITDGDNLGRTIKHNDVLGRSTSATVPGRWQR